MKCDVIIPVYKAPEWVKLCVYALFQNTSKEALGKVILVNDCDDAFTINCLNNLKVKYGDRIILEHNKKNLGFIKTCNRGMKLCTADNILLLNSDCLISPRTIEKLMSHLESDPNIGLICPLASNAANLTILLPEGFNYTSIDKILEQHFSGQSFNACTIVGNCLMITKKCIEKVGLLDEAYGTGYGEETDYQFKAMDKGFTAKVAIDTYVFHKAEASFGVSAEKQARLAKNRELFFSRWGEKYHALLKEYSKNDPIKYINTHLPKDIWQPKVKTIFYLDGIVQNAGGVHTVVDIVNYLTIRGESVNILYNLKYPYKENLLFNPLPSDHIADLKTEQIVSTVWKTAFAAREIADQKHAKLLSFIQGYELYFENGAKYGSVELTYKLSDGLFTISRYLQNELKTVFGEDSVVIPNSINYDLIHKPKTTSHEVPVLTIVMRDNIMKGDWLLVDILKRLDNLNRKFKINIVLINKKTILPELSSNLDLTVLRGPQDRITVIKLLQESDYYIDASLSEGFGLTALEAMAAGCIPIVSDSLGINEYVKHGKNGIVIKEFNNADSFVKVINDLTNNHALTAALLENATLTAAKYDFDNYISKYSDYFNRPKLKASRPKLTDSDKSIIAAMSSERSKHKSRIAIFNFIQKITPRPAKEQLVKVINKLYNYINK